MTSLDKKKQPPYTPPIESNTLSKKATKQAKARTMWVIYYIEMGTALEMLFLIVWWTWPAKCPEGEPR
jgi:hypothetical protein